VDASGARRTTGVGEAVASREGNVLEITGSFRGLASPVAGAELRLAAPAFRGPVVLSLSATGTTEGRLQGRVELSEELRRALEEGHLYIQVFTETNPDGAIRGWLLSGEERN
jgi:hypothetical protein